MRRVNSGDRTRAQLEASGARARNRKDGRFDYEHHFIEHEQEQEIYGVHCGPGDRNTRCHRVNLHPSLVRRWP